MIRDSKTKNKPRETFIIESMDSSEQSFILVRKLGNSLRPRLYKMLPDELIIVNESSMPTKTEAFPGPKCQRKQKQEKPKQKVQVNFIKKSKPFFRHGWDEKDQTSEYVNSFPVSLLHEEETPPTSDDSLNHSDTEVISSENSSDDSLQWDTTPDQYQLSHQREHLSWSSTPFAPSPAHIPPPFPRDRAVAFTQYPLSRRNAFRLQEHNIAFHQGFPARPSRIPLPTSPTEVHTNQVNLLTRVLPLATPPLRRSTRIARNRLVAVGEEEVEERRKETGHTSTG